VRRRVPARTPAADVLERRYRRLFACYPVSYRAASEDEMLGVAMAGTMPGQRWPTVGEVRSLILGGARTRLGELLSGIRGPAWGDACAVFAFMAAVLLSASYGRLFTGHLVPFLPGGPARPIPTAFVLVSGWPLAAAAMALGWRWLAAATASLDLGGTAVLVVARHATEPWALVDSWWQLILAVTASVATIAWLANPRPANRVLPRWSLVAMAGVATVFAASPLVYSAVTRVRLYHGGSVVSSVLNGMAGDLNYGLIAVMAAALLVGLARLAPAVRRRVLIMTVPELAAWALVQWAFGGFLASSPRFAQPVQLTAPQWAALAAVPVLGLVAGMIWLGRHERMLRQMAGQPSDPPLSGSAV
jgi:hypothetical protein